MVSALMRYDCIIFWVKLISNVVGKIENCDFLEGEFVRLFILVTQLSGLGLGNIKRIYCFPSAKKFSSDVGSGFYLNFYFTSMS